MRVVEHRPVQRLLLTLGAVLVLAVALAGGYFLGVAKATLDQRYLASLEDMAQANEKTIETLRQQVTDGSLARDVDREAAQELRASIKGLRDEVAALEEEVRFYKSLMAPSSLERGLQIADFEVAPTAAADQFTYRILLTQVATRRDWIQGDVRVEFTEAQSGRVLSLTEIAELEAYPLKFRFRYFQDLTGVLTLPAGFQPRSVTVTAARRGSAAQRQERTFDWTVRPSVLAGE